MLQDVCVPLGLLGLALGSHPVAAHTADPPLDVFGECFAVLLRELPRACLLASNRLQSPSHHRKGERQVALHLLELQQEASAVAQGILVEARPILRNPLGVREVAS